MNIKKKKLSQFNLEFRNKVATGVTFPNTHKRFFPKYFLKWICESTHTFEIGSNMAQFDSFNKTLDQFDVYQFCDVRA